MFLAVYCSVIIHVSRRQADFIIRCLVQIVLLVFRSARSGNLLPTDKNIVDQIPDSIETAMRRFGLKQDSFISYAVCETCEYTHAPTFKLGSDVPIYPQICGHVTRAKGG